MAARQAVRRAWRSSITDSGSLTLGTRRSTSGRPMLPITSVKRMVPVARKISMSRAGNGWPLFRSKGTDSAPARVTAPRMPARVVARFSHISGFSTSLPALCALCRLLRTPSINHIQRNTRSATEMMAT
ncbi:hypothetical protein D3C72_1907790 [compost metagenome]